MGTGWGQNRLLNELNLCWREGQPGVTRLTKHHPLDFALWAFPPMVFRTLLHLSPLPITEFKEIM